jgi:hypothetical protein
MKKRLKENAMPLVVCITIIICTACIYHKLNDTNWELWAIKSKIDLLETKTESNWWKLDTISDNTNYLQNIEGYVHKIYNEF